MTSAISLIIYQVDHLKNFNQKDLGFQFLTKEVMSVNHAVNNTVIVKCTEQENDTEELKPLVSSHGKAACAIDKLLTHFEQQQNDTNLVQAYI